MGSQLRWNEIKKQSMEIEGRVALPHHKGWMSRWMWMHGEMWDVCETAWREGRAKGRTPHNYVHLVRTNNWNYYWTIPCPQLREMLPSLPLPRYLWCFPATSSDSAHNTTLKQNIIEKQLGSSYMIFFWVWKQLQRRNEQTANFRVILIIVKFVPRDNGIVSSRPAVQKALSPPAKVVSTKYK